MTHLPPHHAAHHTARPAAILDCIGHTPLVPLVKIGRDLPVPIFAKCEHLNPGGSVKDRLARAIIDDAEARGILAPGATLIEATAGNTGMGLALVAAVRGYRLVCVMPEKMSADKRAALRAMGAEVVITANAPPDSPENFQHVAQRLAETHGYFLTDQFRHPANVAIHAATTGPEIFAQMNGEIGVFVAGVGTGGTITGVAKFLKSRMESGIEIVLADPIGSRLANLVNAGELGPDGAYAVEGIGGSAVPEILDLSLIDRAESVSDAESFAMTHRLIREEGLLVGGSAGTAVAAAVRVAQSGRVNRPVVAVLPDSWDRYFSTAWLRAGC